MNSRQFNCSGQKKKKKKPAVDNSGKNKIIKNPMAHGGSGVMVWAGICYGQRPQVHFIDGM